VDGQPTYSEADDEAARRMDEKLWAEYRDYYCSLTPTERSIHDHWNIEFQYLSGLSHTHDSRSIRVVHFVYLCAQAVVAVGLFDLGKIGWAILLLLIYFSNKLYASTVSRFFEVLSSKVRARERSDVELPIIGALTLIGFMFLPIFLLDRASATVWWLAFGLFNYLAFVAARGFLIWGNDGLESQFCFKRDAYQSLTTHGYLHHDYAVRVWYELCATELQFRSAKRGNYFAISFWFPYLYLKRLRKANKVSFPYVAKPFIPYKAKMPETIPYAIYPYPQSPEVHRYRERPKKGK